MLTPSLADKKRQTAPSHKSVASNAKEIEKQLEILANSIKSFQSAEKWVKETIAQRLLEIGENHETKPFQDIHDRPEWIAKSGWYEIENEFDLSEAESFLLAVVFTAQFQPASLMSLWANEQLIYWAGGRKEKQQINVVPTLRTVLFLLAGMNSVKRAFYYAQLVDSRLFKEQVIMGQSDTMDSLENQLIKINDEYYRWLMSGQKVSIEVSADFPAVLLTTTLTFDDLVHKESVLQQLGSLMDFVVHKNELYGHEDFARKVKPGYVALLYGPPGTGKTMTVAVLGKKIEMDVYCVDLSRVVSKYIGETEKNLEKIFQRLEGKQCILFFDEADALFGKRTEVKDARDRYANQEVAYLLQKIERFPGLVILASNYNQNFDSAFKRRILTSIFIPPPSEEEREILWRRSIPSSFKYISDDLPQGLAAKYQLTGANIANVLKLACISAKRQNKDVLDRGIITPLIKLEQDKEKGT